MPESLLKLVMPVAVLMLMVSVGMSLDVRELLANWRRLTPVLWAKLLLATFLVPPACALALGAVLPIGLPALGGLFLVVGGTGRAADDARRGQARLQHADGRQLSGLGRLAHAAHDPGAGRVPRARSTAAASGCRR